MLAFSSLMIEARLHHLDIPVAELLPDKALCLIQGNTEIKGFQISRHFRYHTVQLGKNPLIRHLKILRNFLQEFGKSRIFKRRQGRKSLAFLFITVHEKETGSVPNLIHKVTTGFHPAMIETHIISGCITGKKRHPKRVCTIFCNDFQRIDTVSERLTHLSSLVITNQSVNEYLFKRYLSGLLNSGENHTNNPEEDNVIARNQDIGRIEITIILGIFRPAECLKGPEGTGEPGIQGILILRKMLSSAMRTSFRHLLTDYHFAASIAVVGRNTVSPPDLSGNTPVLDIFKPVEVGLSIVFRNKL